MKKIVVVMLCITMLTTFSGCGMLEMIIDGVLSNVDQQEAICDESSFVYEARFINSNANFRGDELVYYWDEYVPAEKKSIYIDIM